METTVAFSKRKNLLKFFVLLLFFSIINVSIYAKAPIMRFPDVYENSILLNFQGFLFLLITLELKFKLQLEHDEKNSF